MARTTLVTALAVLLLLVATAGYANQWTKFDFGADPGLDSCVLYDGARQYFFPLPDPYIVADGEYIAVKFRINDYYSGVNGHSSLMGPIAVDAPNCFPFVRINLHYTGDDPELSIYTEEAGQSSHYTLQVGVWYCANLIRSGTVVRIELYDDPDADTPVFTDELACTWQTFDRFHVAYDYYTGEVGAYCTWSPGYICCLSDRYVSYIDYCIDSVTLCDVEPTATERSTWGSVKGLFK